MTEETRRNMNRKSLREQIFKLLFRTEFNDPAQMQDQLQYFFESGDMTVTDSVTGLIWQRTQVASKIWQQALEYCENLDYAGYDDWRLPNRNELASLLNHNRSTSPYSDFPNMPSSAYFWSSSSSSNGGNAWRVCFKDGDVNSYDKSSYNFYIKCVR